MRAILYPLFGAVITGIFSGLAVAAWVWALRAGDPLRAGAVVGAIVALCAWLLFHAKIQHVENVLRGYRESPLPPAPTVPAASFRIELSRLDGRQMDYVDLPATPDQVYQLACGLSEGLPFAQSAWVGNRRPFTRPEFEALRAEMIKRKLLEWRNPGSPGQGAQLTHAGKAVMRFLATTPPPQV